MIATAPEVRRLGIATDLVRRSVELASCLGYSGCKTEATSNFSRRAFANCKFGLVAHASYKGFEVDSEKVFAGIQGHDGVAFMARKLQ